MKSRVETCRWQAEVEQLAGLLSKLSFRTRDGRELTCEEGFAHWSQLTLTLRQRLRTIYLIGNGASASMASHFAADLAKNGHLHTQVFSDLSLITAISNDMGYEHVFAEPLRRRAQPQARATTGQGFHLSSPKALPSGAD